MLLGRLQLAARLLEGIEKFTINTLMSVKIVFLTKLMANSFRRGDPQYSVSYFLSEEVYLCDEFNV